MICGSPIIEVEEDLDADKPLELEYGFRMDNVTGVQNLTMTNNFSPFLLFPNPVFTEFDKAVKYYKSEYLNINVSFDFIFYKPIYFNNSHFSGTKY